MTIGDWFRKNGSTILTCLGAGGVIATVALAIKATPKAVDKIQIAQIDKAEGVLNGDLEGDVTREAEGRLSRDKSKIWPAVAAGRRKASTEPIKRNEDGSYDLPKLTGIEAIRVCWKDYIPTVAVGTASLICILGANVLDRKQQASMAAAYAALESAYQGYCDKVRIICGPETDELVQKAAEQEKKDVNDDRPPWDEVQTFYLSRDCCFRPVFFERTMEQVMKAEYNVNRYFRLKGQVTLNEFLLMLDLDAVEGGDEVGWDDYIGEIAYGYSWIDFSHRYFETDDGLTVCSIDIPFGPHSFDEAELPLHRCRCAKKTATVMKT